VPPRDRMHLGQPAGFRPAAGRRRLPD
jgi:hypothetical protein